MDITLAKEKFKELQERIALSQNKKRLDALYEAQDDESKKICKYWDTLKGIFVFLPERDVDHIGDIEAEYYATMIRKVNVFLDREGWARKIEEKPQRRTNPDYSEK